MRVADWGKPRQRKLDMEKRERPLMLKDFLRDNQVSKKRGRHRHLNTKEVPATVRYLIAMDSRRKKKINHKESVKIPCNPPSNSFSALHKATEAIIKILPFSLRCSSQRKGNTTINNNANKFGYFLRRVASLKESNNGSISQRLSSAMRSFSRQDHRNDREIQVRVRDIVQWSPFGDEEITPLNSCNSNSPPPEKSNSVRRSLCSSSSSSRANSCTFSESDYSSNLQSSTDSSVCYGLAHGLNDKTLSPKCYNEKEDKEETTGEFQSVPCSPSAQNNQINSRVINSEAISRDAEANVQKEELVDDGNIMCHEVEGYDEKEQFSPVSILDFPYEDEVATSSFEESLVSIERTKQQLLQKISRYENLAKLDPVDLEKRFSSSAYELEDTNSESLRKGHTEDNDSHLNDEVQDVDEYVRDVIVDYIGASDKRRWGSFELLVIDVFREESSFDREAEEAELVRIAINRIMDWLANENQQDEVRALCLMEMKRNDSNAEGWRMCRMGEEIAAEMEATMLCFLLDDLSIDLVGVNLT